MTGGSNERVDAGGSRPDAERLASGRPVDREIRAVLDATAGSYPSPARRRDIATLRRAMDSRSTTDAALASLGWTAREVDAVDGSHGVGALLLQRRGGVPRQGPNPVLLYFHGGGGIAGCARSGLEALLAWLPTTPLSVLSVEYRLAPEHPDPASFVDARAVYRWLLHQGQELGLSADRIITVGVSAGARLATSLALLAGDGRASCPIRAQMLLFPMLQDHVAEGDYEASLWSPSANRLAWRCLRAQDASSSGIETEPGTARRLDRLPPTYLDAARHDIFWDQDVAFAERLAAAGVPVELQMWPSGVHCFDHLADAAGLTVLARERRRRWLRHALSEASCARPHRWGDRQ